MNTRGKDTRILPATASTTAMEPSELATSGTNSANKQVKCVRQTHMNTGKMTKQKEQETNPNPLEDAKAWTELPHYTNQHTIPTTTRTNTCSKSKERHTQNTREACEERVWLRTGLILESWPCRVVKICGIPPEQTTNNNKKGADEDIKIGLKELGRSRSSQGQPCKGKTRRLS